jgi:uncharacterized protein (DUF1330 family)
MYTVNPDDATLAAFTADGVDDKPIVMVNLLRFRVHADYPVGDALAPPAPVTGRQAYQAYSRAVLPLLWETGGQVLWMGHARNTFIAPEGERWDEAALAYYPSRAAFLRMINAPAYRAIVGHRTAALEDSRLIETRSRRLPTPVLAVARGMVRVKSWFAPQL